MGSMSALMDISRSALNNAQTAINVTASNIANQGVAGYTRRVATFSTGDTVVIGGMPTSTGATASVLAQRDRVLDQRVLNATQTQSAADARLSAMQNIDSIFTLNSDGSDSAGIGAAMDAMFSAFRALQADPSGSTTRQAVMDSAQGFASAMNDAASRLTLIQASLQTQITDALSDVNATTKQVANLNSRIATATSAEGALLQDQRQALLVHLSTLIGFNQVNADNGTVNLTLADGTPLLTGASVHSLSGVVGSTGLRIVTDKGIDVTKSISGGQIGGALQAYSSDVPDALTSLNTLALSVASGVNADNRTGVALDGTAGKYVFNYSATAGTALSLSLSSTDPAILGASAGSQGTTGGAVAAAIAGLRNSAIVNGKTPAAYLSAFLTKVGGSVSAAQQDSDTSADALTQANSQRDALSGVSLDEEAANLTQYQRSYQAAAKVFAIINDLLAASINLGSETTVA